MTSINIDEFPIEIDNDFLSISFSVTSISIDFRYQSILIGGLNRLISMISIDQCDIDFYRLTTSGVNMHEGYISAQHPLSIRPKGQMIFPFGHYVFPLVL